MTTVDRFIANTPGLATAPVSFLKVDTEGHDAFVLKGAWKALEHKQIGMLAFEYGSHWNDTERESPLLSGVVADLDQLGYDSYLVGRKVMLQLNAGLWSYVYAEHPLINVMAILRTHPIKVGCAACVSSMDPNPVNYSNRPLPVFTAQVVYPPLLADGSCGASSRAGASPGR